MLARMLDGRAHTTSELARHCGVALSTASQHLGRLVDGGLVEVVAQGRHRYHRLAGPEVAAVLERLHGLAVATAPVPVRAPAALRFARTCYDHLAGTVAVAVHDRLLALGALVVDDAGTRLGPSGETTVVDLGVPATAITGPKSSPGGRPLARPCLDWTERRPHLAGRLGGALLDAFVAQGWVARRPSSRAVDVTTTGRRALAARLGLDVDRLGHAERQTSTV
jgi:DNA-binding transcriptional ArsR family regulator